MSTISKYIEEAQKLLMVLLGTGPARLDDVEARISCFEMALRKSALKAGTTDPVSGLPIYGPTMLDKMDRLRNLVSELQQALQNRRLCPVEATSDSMIDPSSGVAAFAAPAPRPASEVIDSLIILQHEEKMKEAAASLRPQLFAVDGLKISALQQFRDSLSMKLSELNRSHSDRALGGLQQSRAEAVRISARELMSEIETSAVGKSELDAKTAIKSAISILDAVQRRPDDGKLRTLRWRHEKLQARLASSGMPALLLLLSIGLEVSLERLSPAVVEAVQSNALVGYLSTEHAGVARDVSFDETFRFLVSSRSDQDFVLELKEPNIDDGSDAALQRWMLWFDGLKVSLEALQSLL